MQLNHFLELLESVKPNGTGYQARCPAHDDRKPSLSISEGEDGRILLKDHAGCSTKEIVEAMGLTTADLFPADRVASPIRVRFMKKADAPPNSTQAPISSEVVLDLHRKLPATQREHLQTNRLLTDTIIDRYQLGFEERSAERRLTIPIVDESGSCRDIRRWLPPKARSGDSNKMLHWRNGYGGARLFPVDQLINAAVVLCEGELDALALVSHAIPAVTATCGATTWLPSLSDAFEEKTVTVLMDHDRAGETGAQKRAESLCEAGAKVKVAAWPTDRPEGWDVTDELLKHGPDSLRVILGDASEYASSSDSDPTRLSCDANWPQPHSLPAVLPAVEPFQSALMPKAFRGWIDDVAERMQCPPDYPAVAAMVTLAAVVGRQVGIRPQQRDDWLVVPNLWGAVIGRPGVMKSPALQEPLRPLELLEKQAKAEFIAEQQAHETDLLIAEARRKKGQDDIRKALKNGNDPHEVAIEAMADNTPEPRRRRYLGNDTTVEKLGEILTGNTRGVLVFRDELTGLLKTLDKDGREADKGFYLEAWNGTGRFTYDRIGRGTLDIEAACVSLLGGIQPGPFSAYVARIARGGGDDDGLMQRFQLTVWPDVSSTWSNQDRAPDTTAREAAWAVYHRLDQIDPNAIGATASDFDDYPPYLRFRPDAQNQFTEWRADLESRGRGDQEPALIEAHLAKYRSLVPSLALLIHLADVGQGPVGKAALVQACAWSEYLESHARRMYAPALSPSSAAGHALAGRLLNNELEDGFTLRDIYNRGWHGLSTRDEAQEAVSLLEDLDWLGGQTEKTGGRPTIRYRINPRISEVE